MAKTQLEELRDDLRKLHQEAGGGHVAIKGMLELAEQLVRQEQDRAGRPSGWGNQ